MPCASCLRSRWSLHQTRPPSHFVWLILTCVQAAAQSAPPPGPLADLDASSSMHLTDYSLASQHPEGGLFLLCSPSDPQTRAHCQAPREPTEGAGCTDQGLSEGRTGRLRDWAEPAWRWGVLGGLPDGGLCLQAVEELLESLDLEKSSCCLGLSRVSRPCSVRLQESPGAPAESCPHQSPSSRSGAVLPL